MNNKPTSLELLNEANLSNQQTQLFRDLIRQRAVECRNFKENMHKNNQLCAICDEIIIAIDNLMEAYTNLAEYNLQNQ